MDNALAYRIKMLTLVILFLVLSALAVTTISNALRIDMPVDSNRWIISEVYNGDLTILHLGLDPEQPGWGFQIGYENPKEESFIPWRETVKTDGKYLYGFGVVKHLGGYCEYTGFSIPIWFIGVIPVALFIFKLKKKSNQRVDLTR